MPAQLYNKDHILDACFYVFARNGYKNTSTAMLAEAAGISKALLFHHFKSKKEVYLQSLDLFYTRGRIELGYDKLSDELGFFEAKERASVRKLEYYMNNPDAYNFIIEAFYHTPDELRPELDEKYGRIMVNREKELRRMFEKVTLRQGVDREQAFRLVMLVLDSFDDKYLSGISEQDSLDEEKLRDFIIRRNEFLSMVRFGIEEK